MPMLNALWTKIIGLFIAVAYVPKLVIDTVGDALPSVGAHFSYLGEEAIDRILREHGLYNDFLEGKIKCYVCGSEIRHGTIGVMFFEDGLPYFTCENSLCYLGLLEERARKQYA